MVRPGRGRTIWWQAAANRPQPCPPALPLSTGLEQRSLAPASQDTAILAQMLWEACEACEDVGMLGRLIMLPLRPATDPSHMVMLPLIPAIWSCCH